MSTGQNPLDLTFFCERREVPVMKDTTDCWGCPLRVHPSPCSQYQHYHALAKRSELGFDTTRMIEPSLPSLREPSTPMITE